MEITEDQGGQRNSVAQIILLIMCGGKLDLICTVCGAFHQLLHNSTTLFDFFVGAHQIR
jgi:hypothetical protein